MMKKILNQLELNVQWLALGLGVLFVFYMSYSYLLDPPVKTEVAGKSVGPGEIDDTIWDTTGNALSQAVIARGVPKVEAPNLTNLFADDIAYTQKPLPTDTLAGNFPANRDLPTDPAKPNLTNPDNAPRPRQPNNPVAALPTLDALKLDGIRNGMSSILPPNSGGAVQAVSAMDATWVTVRGEIDIAAIQQSFAAVNIPANARKTSFILLQMDREEKLPDGSWGNLTEVPHIKTSDVQPIPASTAPPGNLWTYLQWAEGHTVDLMQPSFYKVEKGDPWAVPGEQVAAVSGQVQEVFDPMKWIGAKQADIDAQHFTDKQKQAIFKARTDHSKANTRERPSARSGQSPGRGEEGGRSGGSPQNAANDTGRPSGQRPAAGFGPIPPRNNQGQGDQDENEQSSMSGPSAPQSITSFPLPVGAFDPADWLKQHQGSSTITVWAHDETVQPGHTYHYRLTYKIKNPIFFAVNVAKDPELTKQFAITSKGSGWTDEVEFVPTVNFWVVRPPRSSGLVDVQVFRWQAGETKSKQFSVAPGDMIGLKDGEVDFNTGWTVVDVLYDPRSQDYYMLVMDPSGLIHHRDFKTDSADPKLKNWRDQATVATASAAASPPSAMMTR